MKNKPIIIQNNVGKIKLNNRLLRGSLELLALNLLNEKQLLKKEEYEQAKFEIKDYYRIKNLG